MGGRARSQHPGRGSAPSTAYMAQRTTDMLPLAHWRTGFQALVAGLGVDFDHRQQNDRSTWPRMRALFTAAFAQHSASHWAEVFGGTDACVTPVESLTSAVANPHVAARGSVIVQGGHIQPGVAPRFSRTRTSPGGQPPQPGEHTAEILRDFGVSGAASLLETAAAVQA